MQQLSGKSGQLLCIVQDTFFLCLCSYINRTLYCVDPVVAIYLHFHIRELLCELICAFGRLVSTYSVIDSAILVHIILHPPEVLYMLTAPHLYS